MTDNPTRGAWAFSPDHGQPCQIIETQALWGKTTCRVWLPASNAVVYLPAAKLRPLERVGASSPEYIAYVAAASRVADALTHDVLLAPIGSSVIPLPHQIRALARAVAHDRVRYLLADEVGLGKTIEAGLILRELKLRGLVQRTLIVTPKGLASQWVSEMRFHFGEAFQLVLPEDLKALRFITPEVGNHEETSSDPVLPADNPWRLLPQVIVPMDAVKPLEKRKGWTRSQVEQHNQERFGDLVSAGWDLIIVDEAHRLGGSTDQVARYKLGQGLAEAAPYLLLLSATPHQGKTDAFHRLVTLVDRQAFPDVESVTCERVQPYVIRTEKRQAIDAEGKPLFRPRHTQLVPVSWQARHHAQKLLYEAVTNYVREGYNQAMRENRPYIGFLMILMQRLMVSSTSAIRTTLQRRLEALAAPPEQLGLFSVNEDEWADLDGQEQIETLLHANIRALRNERAEVKLLLEATAECERLGPDVKAEALLDWLYQLQAEEGDPELKALVFTEFVPTQEMLHRFLEERGFSVVCLNGSMDMDERRRAQETFAKEARILISTDAGGEGLNLQFCHVVINYDIPWNPMRLEQRIGRVDRIGQTHTVRAINFVFQGSVEHRVREVLEEKLAVIFDEFGIDKTGDVLDSAHAGHIFDEMHVQAIANPDQIEGAVEGAVARLQEQALEARASASVLGSVTDLDPGEAQRLLTHPLPHWVERMTVSYLRTHGGRAERTIQDWCLTWPNGDVFRHAVFTAKEANAFPAARYLTLEEPRVRRLAMRLPRVAPGQPVAMVSVPGVANEIRGLWSLWHIAISATAWNRRRIMPLFVADNGRVFIPTARHIWDQLLVRDPRILATLNGVASAEAFSRSLSKAQEQGQGIYEALVQEHQTLLAREKEKADCALASRRKAIGRMGLPGVRQYRLHRLEQEEQRFREEMQQRSQALPELVPILLLQVEGGGDE